MRSGASCTAADTSAAAIDARLHAERVEPGAHAQRLHEPRALLPDGAFVLSEGVPCLVRGGALLVWSPAGYHARAGSPAVADAALITPPSLVAVLRAGWSPVVPLLHPSALSPPRAGAAPACRGATG